MIHPLHLYNDSLLRASDGGGAVAGLRLREGTTMPLPLDRYVGPADAIDQELLKDLQGPVLDVGCGPGRHLHALAARGVFALGVDISPAAVELATGGGARAVVASIFDALPGSGCWRSALLLDGNIGIGGAPVRLLARIGSLLCDGADLLIELGAPDTPTGSSVVQIATDESLSSWFPWARVSVRDVDALARAGGFSVRRSWSHEARWFARLRACRTTHVAAQSAGRPAGR
jgi:SAM-dependent methyltransferase